MWYQNSLQGVPKTPVYCRVANKSGSGASPDVPIIYDANSDNQTGTDTYGLSDLRQMHNPVTGFFVAPEPGIYWYSVCFYLDGATSTGAYYIQDGRSGRFVSYQTTTGSSRSPVTLTGVVLLTGSETLFVGTNQVTARVANNAPFGNQACFIKLYDIPGT